MSAEAVPVTACRGCGVSPLVIVVDLGAQPACDHFPPAHQPPPDPTWPLALALCTACGLSQLSHDSPAPEEPLAVESATLKRHALEVAGRLVERLGLAPGTLVREYASHHGGSWRQGLTAAGLTCVPVPGPNTSAPAVDVVVDNMAIIHAEELRPELARRVAGLRPDGRLVIEFHHALPQVRQGQFDSIRHGHPLYFSLTSWRAAVHAFGFDVETAWAEDVFGGSLVVSARRGADPDEAARRILDAEAEAALTTPRGYAPLAERARRASTALTRFLRAEAEAGRSVAGYGAGSKGVAFLGVAGVDADLLPVVADLSPAKRGRRIAGTSIPIVSPDELVAREPDTVVVLTWDIAAEVVTDLRLRGLSTARYVVAQPLLRDVGLP